jgi:hypothetical protein
MRIQVVVEFKWQIPPLERGPYLRQIVGLRVDDHRPIAVVNEVFDLARELDTVAAVEVEIGSDGYVRMLSQPGVRKRERDSG